MPSGAALGCAIWLLFAGLLSGCVSTPVAEPPPPPPQPTKPDPEPPRQGGGKWKAITE